MPQELSYFRLSLLSYLRDSHPHLANDNAFITIRGDAAAEAYSTAIKDGKTHDQAGEIANEALYAVAVYEPFFATHNDPARRMAARYVHNYFFLKSVDMVRDGGIVAFITSQSVLNAEQNSPVRKWLMEHCEPISVVGAKIFA